MSVKSTMTIITLCHVPDTFMHRIKRGYCLLFHLVTTAPSSPFIRSSSTMFNSQPSSGARANDKYPTWIKMLWIEMLDNSVGVSSIGGLHQPNLTFLP